MTTEPHDWDGAYAGEAPPWDIGRPQPAFEAIARAGRLTGRVVDIGCGTGEHALLAAAGGADARGVDLSARAIEQARAKASSRGLAARFEVANALTLDAPEAPYDIALDCGLFHVFDDEDRARYVDVLRHSVRAGGMVYLMCFSERQPGDWGPRRVSEGELRAAFADGWTVDLERATLSVNPVDDVTEVQAWFATIRRSATAAQSFS